VFRARSSRPTAHAWRTCDLNPVPDRVTSLLQWQPATPVAALSAIGAQGAPNEGSAYALPQRLRGPHVDAAKAAVAHEDDMIAGAGLMTEPFDDGLDRMAHADAV